MKSILFSLAFIFIGVTGNLFGQNTDKCLLPNEIPLSDKVFILSNVWSEIKYNFVNIDKIDFPIDSLYSIALNEVISSANDIDFYDILEKFLASLNDGHTQLLDTNYAWNDYFDYIPYNIIEIDRKFYFSSIKKSPEIDSSLLGAEILEIEDIPIQQYVIDNFFPYIASSTEALRWREAAVRLCGGIKNSYFNGKARKQDGSFVSFSIKRNGETTRTEQDEHIELAVSAKQQKQRVELIWNEDIAIMEVNSFMPQAIPIIDSLMTIIIAEAKGLVIDLRRNPGGTTNTAHHLQKYLTKDNSFLSFGSQMRINNAYGRAQGNYREEYEDFYLYKAYETTDPYTISIESDFPRISCPVIILIGKQTYSAAEDFLVNIYEVPDRPLMIGEETGGSTGAPLVLTLPHNTVVRICTLRILYPYSMKPFVGKGVVPDVEIKETLHDYITGVDVTLNKAIELLGSHR